MPAIGLSTAISFDRTLLPGEYFLEVSQSSSRGLYDIDFSVAFDVPDGDDTPATARAIDPLTGATVEGAVFPADNGFAADDDFYRLEVDSDRQLDIVVDAIPTNALSAPRSVSLQVFQDVNGNLTADAGETLFQSEETSLARSQETYSDVIAAGTYFVRVFGDASYTLDVQLI